MKDTGRTAGTDEVENNRQPPWSQLLPELVSMICHRLCPSDVPRFAAVCKHWYSCAFYFYPADSTPILIKNTISDSGLIRCYSPYHNKMFIVRTPLRVPPESRIFSADANACVMLRTPKKTVLFGNLLDGSAFETTESKHDDGYFCALHKDGIGHSERCAIFGFYASTYNMRLQRWNGEKWKYFVDVPDDEDDSDSDSSSSSSSSSDSDSNSNSDSDSDSNSGSSSSSSSSSSSDSNSNSGSDSDSDSNSGSSSSSSSSSSSDSDSNSNSGSDSDSNADSDSDCDCEWYYNSNSVTDNDEEDAVKEEEEEDMELEVENVEEKETEEENDNEVRDFTMSCCPVLHKGLWYCLGKGGRLGVYYPKRPGSWDILHKPTSFGSEFPHKNSYLVESSQELLAVLTGKDGTPIHVLKLKEQEMTWEKIDSLGSRAIFTGTVASLSMAKPPKAMANKVYLPKFYGHPQIIPAKLTSSGGRLFFVPEQKEMQQPSSNKSFNNFMGKHGACGDKDGAST